VSAVADAAPLSFSVTDDVGRIMLDRPERHNAFDESLIGQLSAVFDAVANDSRVRVVVLSANGKSFCAGADLDWMRRTASYSREENEADARRLADMLAKLAALPKPTVALVQGAAFGGGIGLIAAADIAIAATNAVFSLSEVRLGLIPSVISPYVIAAMGARVAQALMLTAERFDAKEALRVGLIHRMVPASKLVEAGESVVNELLAGAPGAQTAVKRLVRDVANRPLDGALTLETARRIAETRAGAEAKEGIAAFFERKPAPWVRKP
jgi:methylglutaconyl-CoA hydratase